ncbi:hypothetical protein Q0Z83_021300 [Actinoplanes sichuanensis]|uniref:Caspase domain-containing protein n=1 Tax=Actinoplanes sichuanensis TaxID=512349 RepID=A0ABW4AJT3_9ACTN|nr:caspase family protein [Actinoplanes sichuanensis]BEL03939.1 hypothetical protein Q0Z83_021300 [Actinoplanes sichuanensis]
MSKRRLALVVAVDHYGDAALNQLASPAADAEALVTVLGDQELGRFEVDVLRNSHSWTICQHIEELLTNRHPTDLVLLHFSCHGLKDVTGELYLAATNTRPDLLGSTAVEAAWVNRMMQRSRARRVVLFLDCCYGGAFERGVVARSGDDIDVGDQFRQDTLGEGQGRVVITASTAMEYAFEGATLTDGGSAEPSVFTGAVVEGIRSGDADHDRDGRVSVGELYDFVYDRVRERTSHQTPVKWEFGVRGEMYMSRTPRPRTQSGDVASEPTELARHQTPSRRLMAVHQLAVIAKGEDLAKAAAARVTLQQMIDDDSRAVSTSAAAAVSETRLRLATDAVDFGRVAAGQEPATCEVAVFGGPLAQSSTVTADEPLQAWITGAALHLRWSAPAPGNFDGFVTLRGPAGTAHLRVTGRASEHLPPALDPRKPPAAEDHGTTVPERGGRKIKRFIPAGLEGRTARLYFWVFTTVLGLIIVIVAVVLATFPGLILRPFDSAPRTVDVGDCIRRAGDQAVEASCTDEGAFKVVSIVDSKDQCTDPVQPYLIDHTESGQDRVLCLTTDI